MICRHLLRREPDNLPLPRALSRDGWIQFQNSESHCSTAKYALNPSSLHSLVILFMMPVLLFLLYCWFLPFLCCPSPLEGSGRIVGPFEVESPVGSVRRWVLNVCFQFLAFSDFLFFPVIFPLACSRVRWSETPGPECVPNNHVYLSGRSDSGSDHAVDFPLPRAGNSLTGRP